MPPDKGMNLAKRDSIAGKPASRAITAKTRFAGYARRYTVLERARVEVPAFSQVIEMKSA
jgi:hypothetical protein